MSLQQSLKPFIAAISCRYDRTAYSLFSIVAPYVHRLSIIKFVKIRFFPKCIILCPNPVNWACLSVRQSVACLNLINSRTKRRIHRKPKISTIEAHHTSNPRTYLEVNRSKIKVTRSGPVNVRQIEAVLRAAKCAISSESEGIRTLNLEHRWRTKICITNKHHDLQGQSSRSQGHVIRLTGVSL